MKRFLKTLAFLVIFLFVLVTGVDTTLGHFAKSAHQATFVTYDQKGAATFVYNGDLDHCAAFAEPAPATSPALRRKAPGSLPVSTSWNFRWL